MDSNSIIWESGNLHSNDKQVVSRNRKLKKVQFSGRNIVNSLWIKLGRCCKSIWTALRERKKEKARGIEIGWRLLRTTRKIVYKIINIFFGFERQ